jgi:mRNA interferase RelE/StbE
MIYRVITTKSIQKELDNLPKDVQEKVCDKILELSENPRLIGVIKLKGYENEYRARVADYRIRDEINDKDKVVLLMQCMRRRDVYKTSDKV